MCSSNPGLETQQLGDLMCSPHATPKTGPMIIHLSLWTIRNKVSSWLLGPGTQWARVQALTLTFP